MRIFGFVFALILTVAPLAARAEPPPLEAFGRPALVSSAEISPDGTMVAMIANLKGSKRLMIYTVEGELVYQVDLAGLKTNGVRFYDNEHVILSAYTTTRTYGFRGEYDYSAAFSLNLKTKKIVQLLRREKSLYPAQSGIGRIVGSGSKSGTVLMPAFVGSAASDPSLDLLRADLGREGGRTYKRGTPNTIDWFTSEAGEVIAREEYNNRRNLYRIQVRQNNNWLTIYERENVTVPEMGLVGLSEDEKGLLFFDNSVDREDSAQNRGLMRLNLDGSITGPILGGDGRSIDRVFKTSSRRVIGVDYSGMEPDYEFLEPALTESYQRLREDYPDVIFYLHSWSEDYSRVLYRIFGGGVSDLWLIHDVATNELKPIINARPDIPEEHLALLYKIEYSARDGLKIPAIVTVPQGTDFNAEPRLPLIVMPHGGPEAYDRVRFDWMAQFFASRGYAVLQPNFRGSSGFGRAFLEAGRGEWGRKMQDDVTDGVYALDEIGVIDPEQVCIVGASYGGYSALAGAVFTPDLYKCVVAIAPVSDIPKMLSDEKKYTGADHWVISYWEEVIANGKTSRETLKSISPVNFAENVQAPILLLHGDDDTVVLINQSERMRKALRRADKDVTFIKLKGEDHWLSVAETRLQLLKEIDVFLAEHLPVAP